MTARRQRVSLARVDCAETGIINAHEYFKDRYKLSLKEGAFVLCEHIDEHPLFLNNFGMASRLQRFIYSDTPLPPGAFRRQPPEETARTTHMGPFGR